VHWNVSTARFSEELRLKSHMRTLWQELHPTDMTMQIFGVSYAELEPYFNQSSASAALRVKPASQWQNS